MEKQWVKDLKDKEQVDSTFLVKEKTLALGKNGRLYMSLKVGDKSGQMDSRVWDNVDDLDGMFVVGDLVKIRGQVQVYQSRRQLIVHKLERVEADPEILQEFLPAEKVNIEDLWVELLRMMGQISNSHLRQLVNAVLEDSEISAKLKVAPAARSIHHAWRGGLLEHVVSISKTMEFLAKHYSFLNRDLLYFGALFHDLGKIWELSYDGPTNYTDRGRLIGHMQMSCELIDKKSGQIFGFPEELRDICKHIILSHHGKLEYGSPKRPKFLEALVVAMVDEMDSRIVSLKNIISEERSEGARWSRYNELFDRYFLLDDLKEKWETK